MLPQTSNIRKMDPYQALTPLIRIARPPLTQTAARRACLNAIQFNSIPSLEKLAPNGVNSVKIKVKIATPNPVSRTACPLEHATPTSLVGAQPPVLTIANR